MSRCFPSCIDGSTNSLSEIEDPYQRTWPMMANYEVL